MVDHFGRVVRSSLRQECNVGLTPGGCFDHPGVRDKLGAFLEEIGRRYRGAEALFAWDCWNETRWAVQADAYVCYCHHTVAAYREWLRGRYGDLEGLGAAWHRRYDSWDDVVPGKSPGRPYTDLVEFEAFLTWRSARHAAFRAGRLRDADGSHLVLAHCGKPAVFSSGSEFEQAVSRGNDFDLAEVLDGFGCSHFPAWEHYSVTELGSRIEEIVRPLVVNRHGSPSYRVVGRALGSGCGRRSTPVPNSVGCGEPTEGASRLSCSGAGETRFSGESRRGSASWARTAKAQDDWN